MKKLIFSAIAVCALMVASTASAAESRFFVKPPPSPAPAESVSMPAFVVMSSKPPIQLLPGSTVADYAARGPWSFLVQSRGDSNRFATVGRYTDRDACESERAEVAESADVSYVSAVCSKTE